MEKKLLTPKNRLTWFLNFISAKIDSLSDRELLNLLVDLWEMVYGSLAVLVIRDEFFLRWLVEWPARRQQAKEIQADLRELLENILSVSMKDKKAMIRPASPGDFDYIEETYTYKNWPPGKISTAIEAIIRSDIQKKAISPWAKEYIASSHDVQIKILADKNSVFTYFSQPKDKLVLEFSSLLAQFPLNSIQKCQREDCGAYFLRATKRQKRYCSNKCAWRMASRERRKIQPEKERRKKRESYYRKRIGEFGPNIKIQKKQRKEG